MVSLTWYICHGRLRILISAGYDTSSHKSQCCLELATNSIFTLSCIVQSATGYGVDVDCINPLDEESSRIQAIKWRAGGVSYNQLVSRSEVSTFPTSIGSRLPADYGPIVVMQCRYFQLQRFFNFLDMRYMFFSLVASSLDSWVTKRTLAKTYTDCMLVLFKTWHSAQSLEWNRKPIYLAWVVAPALLFCSIPYLWRNPGLPTLGRLCGELSGRILSICRCFERNIKCTWGSCWPQVLHISQPYTLAGVLRLHKHLLSSHTAETGNQSLGVIGTRLSTCDATRSGQGEDFLATWFAEQLTAEVMLTDGQVACGMQSERHNDLQCLLCIQLALRADWSGNVTGVTEFCLHRHGEWGGEL